MANLIKRVSYPMDSATNAAKFKRANNTFLWLTVSIILTNFSVASSQIEVTSLVTALQLVVGIADKFMQVWETYFPDGEAQFGIIGDRVGQLFPGKNHNAALLASFKRIELSLQTTALNLAATQEEMARLVNLPKAIRSHAKMERLLAAIRRVETLHTVFESYQKNRDNLESGTLLNFAHACTSLDEGSIHSQLGLIHSMIVPSSGLSAAGSPGLFEVIRDSVDTKSDDLAICHLQQSPHQLLYNFYTLIAMTELRGFIMMEFSWMILRMNEKGNFTHEAKLAVDNLKSWAISEADAAKLAIAQMDTGYWRCDPSVHKEGETFVQLTELLQGHLENEADLNADGTCRHNCGYYQYTTAHGCYKNLFCAKQRPCKGRLVNCNYVDSDMDVCLSKDSKRRYDWIQYEDGRRFGAEGSCRGAKHKVDSWWRWLFWHCSYCLCLCDESGPRSDRYFSLRTVEADTSAGMVMTGIRFVKVDRIIHMQIMQGRAMPRGDIDVSKNDWQAVKPMKLDDPAVKTNVDYLELSYEVRDFDLDHLRAPDGYCIIGSRFRKLGTHLNLEIRVAKIDWATGNLRPETAFWISNDNTPASDNPRAKVIINHPDVPTRSRLPSKVDPTDDTYLEFSPTGGMQDASQSTIPFLDAQPVTNQPPTWLLGLEVTHKGRPGYGGFIMFKIYTIDYTRFLDTTGLTDIGPVTNESTSLLSQNSKL